MKKVTLSLEVLAAIIAVTILQACAATTTTSKCQCEKPILDPASATAPVGTPVTVRLHTNTTGAKVRYTLTGSTPTTGSTPGQSGDVPFQIEVFGRTLTATAYKSGCTDSPPAVGYYKPL